MCIRDRLIKCTQAVQGPRHDTTVQGRYTTSWCLPYWCLALGCCLLYSQHCICLCEIGKRRARRCVCAWVYKISIYEVLKFPVSCRGLNPSSESCIFISPPQRCINTPFSLSVFDVWFGVRYQNCCNCDLWLLCADLQYLLWSVESIPGAITRILWNKLW